jgi:hypothetical protein
VGKGITKEAFANSRPRTNQTELNQPPSGDGPESRRMQGSGRSMPRTRATLTALTPDVRKDSTPRAGPGPDLLCQRRNKPAESQLVRCLGLGIVRLRGHSRPPGHHEMQFRPRVTETHLLQVTAPDRAGRQSLWLLPRSVHASQCLQGTPVDLQTPPDYSVFAGSSTTPPSSHPDILSNTKACCPPRLQLRLTNTIPPR